MRRLYFRIILGVLAVLFVSFTFPQIVFRITSPKEPAGGMPMMVHGVVELIHDRLEMTEPDRQEQVLDSLAGLFDFPLRLVDSRSAEWADGRYKIQAKRAPGGPSGQGETFAVTLRNSERVLIVGPTPPPPRPSARQIALLVVLVLAITGFAGFLMIAPLVRDLRKLEQAASRFGDGELNSRVETKSRSAVAIVARQFNRMAESIQKLILRERQLLQSVSHEMRTPIARIRFSLEMLRAAKTPEEQRKRVDEIDGEIGEVDQLVGELLDYNRVHGEGTALKRQQVVVREVLEEVVQRSQNFRSAIEIEIRAEGDTECKASIDRMLFRRAIENLVANALRFAAEEIVIAYRKDEATVIVEVSDDGPGIPEQERELIMMPFYRGEERRERESRGVGLGLAIVKRIVELHGGSIRIEVAAIGGAKFATVWPEVTS